MIATVHFLLGLIIGEYAGSIPLIIFLAVLSHYLLDFIPHYSPTAPKNRKDLFFKSIEPTLGIALSVFFIIAYKENSALMFLGAFFSWLPDFFSYIQWKFNVQFLFKILPRPGNRLYNGNNSFLGMIITAVFLLACLVILVLGIPN